MLGPILDRSACRCSKGSLLYKGVKLALSEVLRGCGLRVGSIKEERYIAGITSELLERISCSKEVRSSG